MDYTNDKDYSAEISRQIEARLKLESTPSSPASTFRASRQGEGVGIRQPLPDSQQPNVNGYRDPTWFKREMRSWEIYPTVDNPRISLVKVRQGDSLVTVEYRWWVEACPELEQGHDGECTGVLLEHTGPGGEWVKERECDLHGFRWKRAWASPIEKKQELEVRIAAANIPHAFTNWTFYNFPRQDDGPKGAALEYASAGKLTNGLLLMGPYGTGKTSLAISILHKRIQEHGERGLFTNVNTLFEEIKRLFGQDNASTALINRVMNVPVLVLDDLGAERPTEWVQSNLYNILNYRVTNSKPTIITTNLDFDELIEQVGARTVERLKRPGRVIFVGGSNLRDIA